MNDLEIQINRNLSNGGSQAVLLDHLTRDLAHCCQSKECLIYKKYGLTASEGSVLISVSDHGASAPSILARQLGLARSRLTPLTTSLVEKGFLKREESSRDRRVRELTLTEEGRRISEAASKFRREFHQKLLSRYAEPERQRMLDTLTMLRMEMESLKKGLCEDANENH